VRARGTECRDTPALVLFATRFLRRSDVPYPDARYLGLTPAQYACFGLFAYATWRLRAERPLAEGRPAHVVA
jgi:hypothetical protein